MNSNTPPTSTLRSSLTRNWVSLGGAVIIAGSVFAFLLLMVLDLFAKRENPYLGVLTWIVAPGFFFLGALLVFAGWRVQSRQLRRMAAGAPLPALVIDFSKARDRRRLMWFATGAVLFLFVTAVGSYQSYRATKSVAFCGLACHTVMEPQYVAFFHSPHANVACTDCHVGPGATGFVESKFNGLHQVYQALLNRFDRPVVGHGKLRISERNCSQCHWAEKFAGNVERIYQHYLDDEANTPYTIRMLLHVGGGDPTHGPVGGIHWHMGLANKVEYIATDPARQEIPWVRLTESDGTVTEFRVPGFDGDPAGHKIHKMTCMDCHNRPAHRFHAPTEAVDRAMSLERIPLTLPGIKREAVLALTGAYATREEAREGIAAALRARYPDNPSVEEAVAEVLEIHRRNFFPEMKTDWRAHPDNIGHKNWAGCFRCHSNQHVSTDGKRTIRNDKCTDCHTILAEGRGAQPEQLALRGVTFKHPVEGWDMLSCHECHTGDYPRD